MVRTKVDASEVPECLRHPLFDVKGEYFFQASEDEGVPPLWWGQVYLSGGEVVAATHGVGVVVWYGPESDTNMGFPDAKTALVNLAVVLEDKANRLESKAEELTEELRQHDGLSWTYSGPFGQHKSEYIPEHPGPYWWKMKAPPLMELPPLAGLDGVLAPNKENTDE